jgi:hypothetical protein
MVYEASTTSLLAIAGGNLDPIGGQAKHRISHGVTQRLNLPTVRHHFVRVC